MREINLREKQKQESRAKILKSALTLFGKQGIQATGIDQIMKKANLTAGAFYAHFKSKNHLIEEVLWSALPMHRHIGFDEFLPYYLTQVHRDHPEKGCPLGTLGSELSRADRKVKQRIAARLDEAIRERMKSPSAAARKKALKILSTAVGALILARITQGSELSDEFLDCHR